MKPWYKSKTIWFNIGSGLLSLGTELAAFAEFLAPEHQMIGRFATVSLVAVGNIILRAVTREGIV